MPSASRLSFKSTTPRKGHGGLKSLSCSMPAHSSCIGLAPGDGCRAEGYYTKQEIYNRKYRRARQSCCCQLTQRNIPQRPIYRSFSRIPSLRCCNSTLIDERNRGSLPISKIIFNIGDTLIGLLIKLVHASSARAVIAMTCKQDSDHYRTVLALAILILWTSSRKQHDSR